MCDAALASRCDAGKADWSNYPAVTHASFIPPWDSHPSGTHSIPFVCTLPIIEDVCGLTHVDPSGERQQSGAVCGDDEVCSVHVPSKVSNDWRLAASSRAAACRYMLLVCCCFCSQWCVYLCVACTDCLFLQHACADCLFLQHACTDCLFLQHQFSRSLALPRLDSKRDIDWTILRPLIDLQPWSWLNACLRAQWLAPGNLLSLHIASRCVNLYRTWSQSLLISLHWLCDDVIISSCK